MAEVRPSGIGQVTPYLIVRGAAGAIEFYRRAFDAVETAKIVDERDRVGHSELGIGEGRIFLADEFPEDGIVGPKSLGGTSVIVDIEVNDVEVWVERALALGARLVRPMELPAIGLQTGKIEDPYGHVWLLNRFVDAALDEVIG
jgi:PhnB protein